jgi:adenylyltransferase/sulfurtransferase
MSPVELKERMDRNDPLVLVDVREPWEWELADLPEYGQVRLPLRQLMSRFDQLERDDEIVVYCRSGRRSESAGLLLMHRGFEKVWNLDGGLLRWRDDVDPSMRSY